MRNTVMLIKFNKEIGNSFAKITKVGKTEVFTKGSNWIHFASCLMRKHYFLLWMKKTAFFPIFTMELFPTALSYLAAESTLNFT